MGDGQPSAVSAEVAAESGMSWITMDTKLGRHPKMAALPSDAARYGWVLTLLEAKEQRHAGTFASGNHYRHVMGKYGRFLDAYIKAGLLDKDEDGTIHVHDWGRHQWAVAKARQRGTSEGQDEDNSETSEGQKEDASRAVPVPVYVGVLESTEGVQGEPDAFEAFYRRTSEVPGPKFRQWLNELGAAHGERRLVDTIAKTPKVGTVTDYLRSVQDVLRLEDHRATRAEKAQEERRTEAKRAAVKVLPPAEDISAEEARRLAADWAAEVRR